MNHSSRACRRRHSLWPLGLLLLALWGLAAACAAQEANPPGPRHALQVGPVTLDLELARSDAERARGLMFRTAMAETEGMLFVFDRDQTLRFWMKNTILPLSVAYIAADGTIREIHDMSPGSLNGVDSTYLVRYALELNQGAFGRLGIKVGDRLELRDWASLK